MTSGRLRGFTYRLVASGGQVVVRTFFAADERTARAYADAWAAEHGWIVDGEVE